MTQPAVTVSEEVSEAQWNAYVESHPDATVDHLWGWKRVIEDVFGHPCRYLAARRGEEVTGILPLTMFRSALFGRAVVSLPFLNYGGLLASDDSASDALVARTEAIARECGASYVELRHTAGRVASAVPRQHKLALTRPLPASGEELWQSLDKKVRNQVRKAQKEGLTVDFDGTALVDDFYHVFKHNMRDLGTPVYAKHLFSRTLQQFPTRAQVCVVRLQGRPIAASIVLRFRDTVLVPWASSLKSHRHLNANMLLYWSMLESATRDGVRTFDFGRSSPDSGPHRFKLQWGAVATPMTWEYLSLTKDAPLSQGADDPRFRLAVAVWRHLPIWLTTIAGPRIVRAIP